MSKPPKQPEKQGPHVSMVLEQERLMKLHNDIKLRNEDMILSMPFDVENLVNMALSFQNLKKAIETLATNQVVQAQVLTKLS